MGQMATSINELRAQGSNRLPSQPLLNHKENVNAIQLRSDKVLEDKEIKGKLDVLEEQFEEEKFSRKEKDELKKENNRKNICFQLASVQPLAGHCLKQEPGEQLLCRQPATIQPLDSHHPSIEPSFISLSQIPSNENSCNAHYPSREHDKEASTSNSSSETSKVNSCPMNSDSKANIVILFPSRLTKKPEVDMEKYLFKVFWKVNINIVLFEAIKQILKYAKFLKDLCINKKKLKTNEMVTMNENVSVVLKKKCPPKCKDMGSFSIPIQIGNNHIEKAMCDFGASINVMPYTIYLSLRLGPLEETG